MENAGRIFSVGLGNDKSDGVCLTIRGFWRDLGLSQARFSFADNRKGSADVFADEGDIEDVAFTAAFGVATFEEVVLYGFEIAAIPDVEECGDVVIGSLAVEDACTVGLCDAFKPKIERDTVEIHPEHAFGGHDSRRSEFGCLNGVIGPTVRADIGTCEL